MEANVEFAIKEYQCPGCSLGSYPECFKEHLISARGIGCSEHYPGTHLFFIDTKVYLGLPKGFNRLGKYPEMIVRIYNSFSEGLGSSKPMFNVPVWKYLNENGHTIVRGIMPRINEPFLDIYLEDCMDKISCLTITDEDISKMD